MQARENRRKRRRWREERGEWPGIYTVSRPFHRDWDRIPFEHILPKMESGHRERTSHVVTTSRSSHCLLVYHSGPFCNHHGLSEQLPTWVKHLLQRPSQEELWNDKILQPSIRPSTRCDTPPPPLHGSQRWVNHRFFPEILHNSC